MAQGKRMQEDPIVEEIHQAMHEVAEWARMQTPWTPGPWEIWTGCSYRRIGSVSTGREVVYPVVARDGHPDMVFVNGGQDGPDARLIAAAPDLAEALEVLCNSIETTECAWEGSSMHRMARAALAKAKGEQ